MKNVVFWDVMPCVPSSLILVTLMMEALRSSKTSDLTRATRHSSSSVYVPPLMSKTKFHTNT
jgi:hypothetical protein